MKELITSNLQEKIRQIHPTIYILFIFFCMSVVFQTSSAQSVEYDVITIAPELTYQTVVGFGASLAYYENWLTAHPNKAEIYEAIFAGLSLDILRLRNTYDYDSGMVGRASEFAAAAKASLGKPIAILSTSWGPPKYLKSNNDRKNGGTIKYTVEENGVNFDYAGFANWWDKSLDEYNGSGIYPTYISIQNEPDFSADWESCLLNPNELVDGTDTIAGYNIALDSVYNVIQKRDNIPKILGPETTGIGYNSVENYVNELDESKLFGIAHHLYHGVDENDPYATTDMTKVGNFHPEIPHFQTEYSRGDWFSLAGLIYKSFHDENVVAYLYWDLIWDGRGLVSLDFPWDKSRWIDPQKGYTKTKEYYAFKQFSKFIHPGWQRISTSATGSNSKSLCFFSPDKDSATFVVVNTSFLDTIEMNISIPGYCINESSIYRTSEDLNCEYTGELLGSVVKVAPHSILTIEMAVSDTDTSNPVITSTHNDQSIPANENCEASLADFIEDFVVIDNCDNELVYSQSPIAGTIVSGYDNKITLSATDDSGNSTQVSFNISVEDNIVPIIFCVDDQLLTTTLGKTVYLVQGSEFDPVSSSDNCELLTISNDFNAFTSLHGSELPLGISTITWTVTDEALNTSSCSFDITVSAPAGIEGFLYNRLKVYPNPFIDFATIEFSLQEKQSLWLTIFDIQGREVIKNFEGEFSVGNQRLLIGRKGLKGGVYFFKLENSKGEFGLGRFIVQD